jgi:hypothetical protein
MLNGQHPLFFTSVRSSTSGHIRLFLIMSRCIAPFRSPAVALWSPRPYRFPHTGWNPRPTPSPSPLFASTVPTDDKNLAVEPIEPSAEMEQAFRPTPPSRYLWVRFSPGREWVEVGGSVSTYPLPIAQHREVSPWACPKGYFPRKKGAFYLIEFK